MAVRGLDNVIEIAHRVWGIEPHRRVRIPSPNSNEQPIPVDALWTDYGLRPNSNNLSLALLSMVLRYFWYISVARLKVSVETIAA